ncbi:hypothetical protein RF11_00378 [Thelohanellus kitauei]|uniref:Uncharacterized protein n=1 Tax=Thelohanellus kitauei TaxID=669202 RepID=A0A0C2NAZ4_THEKT|nr:hypothetical protein RF11_00378 [Thelohanellus kitauei]
MKGKTPQHCLHSDVKVVGHIYLCVLVVFCHTWIEIDEPINSNLLLNVSKLIIIDLFNHCLEVCRWRNLAYFNNPQLGNGNEQRINGQTPDIVIQIEETLLKGKRRANVGRLLPVQVKTFLEKDCTTIAHIDNCAHRLLRTWTIAHIDNSAHME